MASRTLFRAETPVITISFILSPLRSGLTFLLAAVSLLLCGQLGAWSVGCVFALGFVLTGLLRLEGQGLLPRLLAWLWCVGVVCMPGVLGPLMIHVFSFRYIGLFKILLNLALCAIPFLLLLSATGKPRLSAVLSAAVMMLLAAVNSYVYLFRSRELSVMDIFAAGTALSVAEQYDFAPNFDQVYPLLLTLLALCAGLCLPRLPRKRHRRPLALVSLLSLCLFLHLGAADLTPFSWNRDGSQRNGFYLNLYLTLRGSRVAPPEGYDPEALDELAQQLPPQDSQTRLPNIIVIMDEAFSDLRNFPNYPQTDIPVTPCIDALSQNTIRGTALVSVFGGNTANSEFEFLTGHSMAFLPASSVPYTQYIRSEICSLPAYLASLGYDCLATHSFDAKGWGRDVTYPLLGFRQSTFLEAYPQEQLLRGYVSDEEQFSYMLRLLQSSGDAPVFLFGVTMQNHGGYTYSGPDLPPAITLTEYPGRFPQAEQYLSLIHETDQAVSKLLSALEQEPEDTIVLFFGDHLPILEEEFYETLNGGPLDTPDEAALQYQVPFFIWANFELPQSQPVQTSLNYLAGHLLDAAGVAKPAWLRFLAAQEEAIPAMNAQWYFSPTDGHFQPLDQAGEHISHLLDRYEQLQYNALFDEASRSSQFFPSPTS